MFLAYVVAVAFSQKSLTHASVGAKLEPTSQYHPRPSLSLPAPPFASQGRKLQLKIIHRKRFIVLQIYTQFVVFLFFLFNPPAGDPGPCDECMCGQLGHTLRTKDLNTNFRCQPVPGCRKQQGQAQFLVLHAFSECFNPIGVVSK